MKPAIAPIGLDYLADSLQCAGHEARLLDLCFAQDIAEETEQCLRRFSPDVIGVTIRNTDDCYFHGQAFFLPKIREVLQRLRKLSAAPIVLGGAGFSVAPAAVLEFCGADFGIVGEGEIAILELLKVWESRSGCHAQVPNLVYRDNGGFRQNPLVPVNLAALPPRRRMLPDNPQYFRQGGQAGFETKRGCGMACVYCADPVIKGSRMRLMPPARVVGELSALLAQGIDHFHTCDSEFNLPGEHAREVCRAIIDAGLGDKLRWYAYCAPVPFDDELANLFKRAGGAGIDFGADSGCDQMLRQLGRNFTTTDLERTAHICHRHDIPFMFDMLLGGPGETRESVRRSIDFIRRVSPDCVGLSLGMRIYEGTLIARQVCTGGVLAEQPDLYGARQNNPGLLRPVFYVAPELGADIASFVRELVAGDPRFFLPNDTPENANYNYNDNTALERAIEAGARGAYWNILRKMRG
jgi:hypothetical protein